MNTRSARLVIGLLLGVLVVPVLPAASADTPARAFRINVVEHLNQPVVEPGTPQFTVRRVLGEPRRKLDANTWLYDRFSACNPNVDTGDCTTLVVTFAKGEVTELKLVNDRAEKVIAANLAKKESPLQVAAK